MKSVLLTAIVWILTTSLSTSEAAEVCSKVVIGTPVAITQGVTYQPYDVTCLESAESGPFSNTRAHVTAVDLSTKNLSVLASNTSYNEKLSHAGVGQMFPFVLPSTIVTYKKGSPASTPIPQVAVNANLFTNCCTYNDENPDAMFTFLRGLEAAGTPSNVAALTNQDCTITDATFASSLIMQGSTATIWTAKSTTPMPQGITAAVTGSHLVVAGSNNIAPTCLTPIDHKMVTRCGQGSWLGLNARTAVGLQNATTLLMVVVEGTDGTSGVSLRQLGDLLVQFGAVEAINLDGGGSSTMARKDIANGFVVLNALNGGGSGSCTVRANSKNDKAPFGNGCERYVGAALYVTAP